MNRRGFYTGMAAALVFFALSVLWLLASAGSSRQVSDLVQFESLQVSERSADALPFLSFAVADAESDAAFGVHGCVPSGSFFAEARRRVSNYTLGSALVLSDSSVNVSLNGLSVSIVVKKPVPPGFTHAYDVNTTLNATLQGGPIKALRILSLSDVVVVNATKTFRVLVNRSGVVDWDVSVNCP